MTGAFLLALAIASSSPATVATPPAERAAPVVAGAAAAGFVGGALFAVPTMLSLLPTMGPFVALPVALLAFGAGAGFGGFLGELAFARLGTASAVGGLVVAGTIVGTSLGALGGGMLGLAIGQAGARAGSFDDVVGLALGGLGGAALGGLAASATTGALSALWLTPEER